MFSWAGNRITFLILGLFGGLLAGLSLSQSVVFFMPISLALLWAVNNSPLASFLWGVGALIVSHSWLLALHPLGWIGVPDLLSWPFTIAIWLFCGVFAGGLVSFWSWLGLRFFNQDLVHSSLKTQFFYALAMSSAWGFGEVCLSHWPLFWIGIGETLLPGDLWLAGLARWIGSGGLATIQLLIGWWVLQVCISFKKNLQLPMLLGIGLLFLFLTHFVGWNLLNKKVMVNSIDVALWQTAIPTREKFSKGQQVRLPKALANYLERSHDLGASLLLAPEGTLNFDTSPLEPVPIPLLSGGFRWVKGSQRSSLLVFEKGKRTFSGFVDKVRLVPLGEWLPDWSPLFGRGLSYVGGLEPGEVESRLLLWSGPPVATAICYELSDGKLLAQSVAQGAEWMVALSNLDPYPISLQKQFLSLAQMRSIENARDLVSVSNTGPSSLILSSGQVIPLILPFQENLALAKVNLHKGMTGYHKWGETPLIAIFAIGLIGLFYNHRF